MKSSIKYAGLFSLAALASYLLSTSSPAEAEWFVRQHASNCYVQNGNPIDLDWAIQNDSDNSAMLALCPVIDESGRLKETTHTLNVHGQDNSTVGYVEALACRGYFAMTGGTCQPGPATDTRGTGHYWITIPTNQVWNANTAGDFGYVYVSVPARQGTYRSTLRGYFQAGD